MGLILQELQIHISNSWMIHQITDTHDISPAFTRPRSKPTQLSSTARTKSARISPYPL